MSGKRGRMNKVTLGMLKGKPITTSVPSIAVRFHSGDEELDIYPSADDEDDGEKDEFRSSSGSATVASSSPPSNASPSMQSRDPSPMKEYLKGLGKRSTSVDAHMMDVGSSGSSDTWRIFHELKGKITKTVEEKLTEIKSERRSTTPLFSGKSSPRHGRLRAGANSQENSSVSDSEDVSETSNKDESRSSYDAESATALPVTTHSLPFTPHPTPSEFDEVLSTVNEESSRKMSRKERKAAVRNRKAGGQLVEMSSPVDDDSGSDRNEEHIESGVEVSEETKFTDDNSFYENIPTIDYTVYPPAVYTPAYIDVRRKSSVTLLVREPKYSVLLKKSWAHRKLIIFVVVFFIVFFVPLPAYIRGLIMGVLLTLFYHLIVGLKHWFMPSVDLPITMPFTKLPNYAELPVLEVPMEPEIEVICKYGGWMNELTEDYDPDTYHINNTQSVYVRLNGSIMRISHPKAKIPKRQLWNERKLKLKFIHQRIYDIADCSIKLLPEGMTRKRRWSKKYPLCITLTKEAKRKETVVAFPMEREPDQDKLVSVSQTSSLGEETVELGGVDEVVILKPFIDDRSSDTSLLSRFSATSTISLIDRDEGSALSMLEGEGSLLSTLGKEEEETVDFSQIREKLFANDEGIAFDDEYCIIDEQPEQETCLYLFSRTDRQKEDWYRKFVEAMKSGPPSNEDEDDDDYEAASTYQDRQVSDLALGGKGHHEKGVSETTLGGGNSHPVPKPKHATWHGVSEITLGGGRHQSSTAPGVSDLNLGIKRDGEYAFDASCYANIEFLAPSALRNADMNYIEFMNKFHLQGRERKGDKMTTSLKLDREVDCDVMWLNVFVGRILYDVLQNPKWINKIQEKIQKKISTIKLPLFVEELTLSGIELGRDVPMIHRASRPILDDHGLWVDLDVTFDGCIQLTIETKINLMKMKKEDSSIDAIDVPMMPQPEEEGVPEKSKSPIYDSSVEDSAESSPTETEEEHGVSSSDDSPEILKASNVSISKSPTHSTADVAAHVAPTPSPTPSAMLAEKRKAQAASGKGMIKMMNKFVSSHFFQSAAEYRYIKRAIEGVSNTQITLTVEVRACTGQLALNFPPPPSDRVWYGFRGNPRIWIVVKPKFGQRHINISYITNWLEKKLLLEFQKKFVLPNMDDLVIKPMSTDLPV